MVLSELSRSRQCPSPTRGLFPGHVSKEFELLKQELFKDLRNKGSQEKERNTAGLQGGTDRLKAERFVAGTIQRRKRWLRDRRMEGSGSEEKQPAERLSRGRKTGAN